MDKQSVKSLRILHLEDVPSDAELIEHALKKAELSFLIKKVDNREDYVKALAEFSPDIILSDYALPNFDGMTALQLRNELAPEIPFILVTGSINEEIAVDCIKAGADDYVAKAHLLRLAPAISGVVDKKNIEKQKKNAEGTLRQSELRFRLIAENARDVIYRYRFQPTPGFEYVSPSATKVTGYTPQEYYDDPNLGYNMIHPENRRTLTSLIKSGNPHPEPLELRWVRKDGEIIWAEQVNTPFFDKTGRLIAVDGIAREVTERKRIENALQEERKFSETAVNSLAGLFYVLDRKGRFVRWNKMFQDMLGFSTDHAREVVAADIIHEEDSASLLQKIREALKNGYSEAEARLKVKNSESSRHFIFTARRVTIGTDTYLVGSGIDITERKQLESALEKAAHEWRTTFDSMPDLIMLLDNDNRILRVNKAVSDAMNLPYKDMLGRRCWEVIHETTAPPDYCPVATENDLEKNHSFETFNEKLKKHFLVTTTPHFKDDGTQAGIVHVMSDITAEKQLKEQLLHSQKMEAIGTLAGGVAHDFNNLLAVILGYSRSLVKELKEDNPIRSDIQEIVEAGEKSAVLTRQLLTFSRRQTVEPKIFNINNAISNMNKMLRRIIGEDVDLRITLDPDLGYVKADPAQIEQVIAVNARDAMPKGGKLTVETNNVSLDDRYVGLHSSVKAGNYVRISISDTGQGIDTETKEKIFDPFFTTKEVGKGTGLGLSIVYGIVRQSDGYIWVYSEPDKGATFKIYLPRITDDEKLAEEKRPPSQSPRGSETVLLVEDEDNVRKVIKRILKKAGYNVIEIASGKQAIEFVQENKTPIHLMITDVVMPGISGSELAKQMKSLSPKTKTLYMSGYADEAIVHHGFLEPGTPFVQKPFKPEFLLLKVRELLDAN